MSRFNNPRAFPVPSAVLNDPAAPVFSTVDASVEQTVAEATAGPREPAAPALVQQAGFIMLSVYLLSGYANDLTNHLFHTKAYLSNISELLLPFLLLASGAAFFRSLRTKEGKVWLFYMAWLIIDIPFSVWRGGSFNSILNYSFKNWILFYYVTAFTITRVQLGRLMRVQIVASLLLL